MAKVVKITLRPSPSVVPLATEADYQTLAKQVQNVYEYHDTNKITLFVRNDDTWFAWTA